MAEVKEEKKAPEGGGGMSPKDMAKFATVMFVIVLTIITAVFVAFMNPETAKSFTQYIYGLEVFFILYILFLGYTLYKQIKTFEHYSEKIGHFYETKYKPQEKKSEAISPIRLRYEKAQQHITSEFNEEWKIGIIELDTILKDLLKNKGYIGETVGELLKSADAKGMKTVNIAWEAHRVRNQVVHEGVKFELNNDAAMRAFKNYTTAFKELGIDSL
jgi:hypothetical protein